MERRACILVVDDEARNRALLRGILSSQFEVIEAASGEAALVVVRRAPVDLVLLDVMMPGQDGFETCRLIKAEPRQRGGANGRQEKEHRQERNDDSHSCSH